MSSEKSVIETVTEEVEADFARIEREAASQPGTMEALEMLGACDAAIKQYDDYLAAFTVPPRFSTTSHSG